MQSNRQVWCVGPAKFVREISPLLEGSARVRWVADGQTLSRMLNGGTCDVAIVEHGADSNGLENLRRIRSALPRTRRLVVMANQDLKSIRTYLDDGAATEIIYRPFERVVLLRACGIVTHPAARVLSPV